MSHDDPVHYLTYSNILLRAMEPGGLDKWARIDRRIPGSSYGWVIVPQMREGYSPGAMPVTNDTVAKGIRRLQSGITLADLRCTAEIIDQVDAILNGGHVDDYDPSVAAQIVQIGLFGSIWYPRVEQP